MRIGRKLINKTLLFIALFITVLLIKNIIIQYNEYQHNKEIYKAWIILNEAKYKISDE